MPPSRSARTGSARPSAGPSSSRGKPARNHASQPAGPSTALPAYEAPIAPLTRAAQHQLSTIPIRHDLSSLQSRLNDAHERLASAAADMHEMKTTRVEMAGVRAEKRREKGEVADAADEEQLRDLVRRVDEMTARIEREVRRTVDREARLGESEEALRELSANQGPVRRGAQTQPPPGATQSTFGAPTQTQTQTQMTADGEEPEGATASLIEAWRTKLKDAEAKYDALTMRERYSQHNSYIAFRRMLHSAQYPDDAAAPPVPHASAWFDEGSGAARHLKPSNDPPDANHAGEADRPSGPQPSTHPPPSQPGTQAVADADDADESDIEAVAERTSIRCPLTQQPMREPVTSTRCPHSFERAAILEYLNGGVVPSSQRQPRGPPRAAKCPICEVLLTSADLQMDRVLQRKIRRVQEAEARREEEEDDDDEEDGKRRRGAPAELIRSSSPIRGEVPGSARPKAARVKAERISGVRRGEAMDVDD